MACGTDTPRTKSPECTAEFGINLSVYAKS
jgi:hypothetical protein